MKKFGIISGRLRKPVAAAVLAMMLSGPAARAAPVIEVDEYGNGVGTVGAGFLAPDPGPGGPPSTLTYRLPFAGTQGDVVLVYFGIDIPVLQYGGGTILDVLRFNGNSTISFTSDDLDGIVSLADVPNPPGGVSTPSFYPNFVALPQYPGDGPRGAFYTPLAGQPGYDPVYQPTYRFISERVPIDLPEPASIGLLAAGALAVAASALRHRTAHASGCG